VKITKGKVKKPMNILIYGVDGIGKSSFASQFPDPLFLGPEDGSSFLDVARVENIKDWKSFNDSIQYLKANKVEQKTLVIDSLDWIEPLIHDFICKEDSAKSLELAYGGFGKGYKKAYEMQCVLKNDIQQIRIKQNMNIVLIAHSKVSTFNDPSVEIPYDRYHLKLHESNSVSPRAMWREFVDAVFFLNYDSYTTKEDGVVRANSDKKRYIFTSRTESYDAKTRFKIPDQIELKENNMFKIISSYYYPVDQDMFKQVKHLAEQLADEKIKEKALADVTKFKNNEVKLNQMKNKLEAMI